MPQEHTNTDPMRMFLTLMATIAATSASVSTQDWPAWRGQAGDGVAPVDEAPLAWTATDGIIWKTALPGYGTSSPIVVGDRVFLTAQLGAGPINERGAQFPGTSRAAVGTSDLGAVRFAVLALRVGDGHILWDHQFDADGLLPAVHRNHNLATPSVATDGERVFAWFGTGQLVALDTEGGVLWERHLGQDYGVFDVLWGHGSSPAVHEDLVILLFDHPSGGHLVALDVRTGDERWAVDRGPELRSYSTPVVISHAGRDELIVNTSRRLEGWDPRTGKLRWHAGFPVPLAIGVPVHHDGVLYTNRGYASSPYLALAVGGQGDVSETHIRWRHPTRAPYISSLVHHDGLIYMATENGILTVTDADTGEVVWRERLEGVFTASPIVAAGRLYFLNESGDTVVLKPGRQPEILARNSLHARTLASPAVVEGRMLIRTDEHLFCIGGEEN